MMRVQDLPTLPILGDTIRFNGSVYEVMPVHNENVFKYSDAFKTSIRIHTKEM